VEIEKNDSIGDGNFLQLYGGSEVSVEHNDVRSATGSSFYLGADNAGVRISQNTLRDGAGIGIRIENYLVDVGTGAASTGVELSHNQIQDMGGSGIDVDTAGALTDSLVTRNRVEDSGVDGIHFADGNPGNAISHNHVKDSAGFDCRDDSSGGTGTSGTDNAWTKNKGKTSSPAGLCK